MTRLSLLPTLFALVLFGCDNGIDKSLIDQAVKLNSPYSDFTLYRYHVESSMAFGSGFTAIKILPSDKKCDYTDRDFFMFDNYYPFHIKWKNKDTLMVKCLGESALADNQPIRKDIQKWKGWTFEVEYYSVFSGGTGGSHFVDSYKISPDSIGFKFDKDSLVFNNSEVALALDSNQISLRWFKVDTFNSKTGLSLSNYKLNMTNNYRPCYFYGLQPFITIKP